MASDSGKSAWQTEPTSGSHDIYMSELRAYGFDPAHPKKRRLFS